MPSCVVCGRTRNNKSKENNITFHRLSHDESVQKKWNDFFIENYININATRKNSLICSAHFDSKCFLQYKKTRQLTRNAVPTIIISRVFSAKNVYPEISTSSTLSTILPTVASKPEIKILTNNVYCDGVSTLDDIVSVPDSNITINNILSESVSVSSESSLLESSSTFEIQKPCCQIKKII
eukprot:XP_016656345.1 PREDICTED: uncharacterized protein LOC107882482 [Acyrthosiphon pisum]